MEAKFSIVSEALECSQNGGLLPALLQQFGNQRRPASLVTGPDARSIVPMKILMEQNMIAEMWIALEFFGSTEDRSSAAGVPQEQSRQSPR